jgi:hypothetical protein
MCLQLRWRSSESSDLASRFRHQHPGCLLLTSASRWVNFTGDLTYLRRIVKYDYSCYFVAYVSISPRRSSPPAFWTQRKQGGSTSSRQSYLMIFLAAKTSSQHQSSTFAIRTRSPQNQQQAQAAERVYTPHQSSSTMPAPPGSGSNLFLEKSC